MTNTSSMVINTSQITASQDSIYSQAFERIKPDLLEKSVVNIPNPIVNDDSSKFNSFLMDEPTISVPFIYPLIEPDTSNRKDSIEPTFPEITTNDILTSLF